MSSKFNIGDKVYNRYFPNRSGFITEILEREGDPPPGWVPTETDFIPPKSPLIYLYVIEGFDIALFEYSIEYDKDYYRMINRDDKLKELGI